jgi:raffinose/stachyose/melibiose transport system substrate-binding protein
MVKTALKTFLLAAVAAAALAGPASAGKLTIESWRNDDATIWKEKIIPAFQAKHPDIQVEFNPTAPKEYNAALNARLEGGTAGDIITCRPFDASLELFNKGHLAALNDLPSMANFSDVAKSAWTTDDGKSTFCMPMASVIHGFIYNKDIFKELGLGEPKTEEEFLAVLEKIKANGSYTPLVMGTNDQWEAATMGFQNIGPNYWKGEDGRKKLIEGSGKLTDKETKSMSMPSPRSPNGRRISATATRRRLTPTARTSSASARAPSMPQARGTSRPSAARMCRWVPSSRRCRPVPPTATSRITPISASA